MIHLFGPRVVRFQVLIGDRPGRGDAVVMAQHAEILAPQAIQRGAEQLGCAADEVVHLRLKWLAMEVIPGVWRYVAILVEYRGCIPVLHLAPEPVAALQDQNVLSRRCELPGEGAATRATADDDDVVALTHASLLKADATLHDAAVSKNRCGGEIACTISGEETEHAGDLLRSRHAPQRDGRIQLRELGRILHGAKVDRGRHGARTHADYEDVVAREFDTG